jgi:aromatic-amino-acid transaminase
VAQRSELGNHRFIFERAGFTVNTYPYYDAATGGLKFDAMLAAIDALPARSIVLLHACCHNRPASISTKASGRS